MSVLEEHTFRSHLFPLHVLVVSQVNCRHYSSAVCVIYHYHKSTWWLVNACSQSFLRRILTHAYFSAAFKSSLFYPIPLSFVLSLLTLCSFSWRTLCPSGLLNGWQKWLVCEWMFGWLALLMVCGEGDRLAVLFAFCVLSQRVYRCVLVVTAGIRTVFVNNKVKGKLKSWHHGF